MSENNQGGSGFLELYDRLSKINNEYDKKVSSYVVWLTGLSSGEVVFVLSNLGRIFVNRGILFIISISSLIICIFAGLAYHLIQIVRIYYYRKSCAAHIEMYFEINKQDNSNSSDDKKKEYLESLQKHLEIVEGFPKKQKWTLPIIDISWKVNVFSFFAGSFFLVLNMVCQFLKK